MLCNVITIMTLDPRFRVRVVGVILMAFATSMSGCSRLQLLHREGGETTQTRKTGDTFYSTLENAILGDRPSNDRRWRPDLRVLATADFEGDHVLIRNVRNCRYRTEEDYDVRHYDLDFKLDDVQTVDFVIVPFSNLPLIAHTMLSFGLRNGQYFSISVEGRLEQGENYSATNGTSNEFELIYLIGDERDLIPLRTEVRKVDVFVYPGRATPEQIQLLLIDMLDRANKLAAKPEFYHTLTNNCTTNLVDHVNTLRPGAIPRDWRVLFPGHSDKMLFDLGLLETTGSYQAAKLRARINNRAILYKNDPNFSKRIRGIL
ncbi:MAG: DUF4105 domain-containing protein [Planctomycetota bacterium]|nr:DUF4105 domain-containing protein [Planctomycetota bacterium]